MLFWLLAVNGAARIFCEFFRGDFQDHLYMGTITLSQLLCVGGSVVSIGVLIGWARRSRTGQYEHKVCHG